MNSTKIYDGYWQSGLHPDAHWPEARIHREFRLLKGCSRILDYGCGPISRKYGDVLARSCQQYTGADVSNYIVSQNQKEGYECLTIHTSDSSIGLPDATFDGAVCCEVFEHLYDPLLAAKEIHRLLKPGGKLVAMVPHFGYHAWRLQAFLRAQVPHEPENPQINRHNGVHIRYFSMLTFQRLLSDAGFHKVKVMPYDFSSVWDVTRGLGPAAKISDWARKNLPAFAHLTWLQNICPTLFAMRLKAEAVK
jgi:SAM-dependent methyltransferase